MKRISKIAVALILAIGMVASVLVGCKTERAAKTGDYTYKTYATALGDNWNPHTWETNADDSVLGYLSSPFVDMSIKDSDNGVYQWVYEMATAITDVTKTHKSDLEKYEVTLPSGKTVDEVTEGYVFEIKLNKNAKWENGVAINADSYIYSMKQLLDPAMKNYRANLYYSGESAVAGGSKFYYAFDKGIYVAFDGDCAAAADLLAAGTDVYIDCWDFWGAEGYTDADGNACPQYVSFLDETVYGEAQDDAFSGADLWGYATYGYYDAGYMSVATFEENANYNPDGWNYDETVGCYKVDDYTIIYVTQAAIDFNYFLTSCTSTWLVYEDLYEAGKDTTGTLVTTNYGTSKATSMSYGPYRLESLQEGKQMVFVQNENWYGYEKREVEENGEKKEYLVSFTNFEVDGKVVQQYMTTKIVIDVMEESAAKQAFLKGDLMDWTPSATEVLEYAASDRLYKVDETYTMSFFFNTNLDDLKVMDESKGNQNSVVMSNWNFRKAFSLAVDRAEWVKTTQGYKPNFGLMNTLYYYDIYNDPSSSYRNSDAAMQAICDLYGVKYGDGTPYETLRDAYKSITGYNLTEAKALMKTACDELVEAGLYTAGDPIYIRVAYKKGAIESTDSASLKVIENALNAAVEGSGFGTVTLEAVGGLASRYADVPNGNFCIGYGAWGGAAFYPFRNLQVYCDPDQYDINEAADWDPTTETFTINVEGKDVTMTWQEWSGALVGTGALAEKSNQVKLEITAQLEKAYLEFYYRIPLATSTACSMLAYKLNYYTEDYNIMYGFGGLRLYSYNYNDAEWAAFVAENGGNLSYE